MRYNYKDEADLNWTLDFVSEFRKPIYENATKLLFVGDNIEGKQFYQRVKNAFEQEETDKEYILNDLWGKANEISAPNAIAEIEAADIVVLLENGSNFKDFWKSKESITNALQQYGKPWILVHISGVETSVDKIVEKIGPSAAIVPEFFEIFYNNPLSKLDKYFSTTFRRELKEAAKSIKEGKIQHDKLKEDLYEFDLDTPTNAFKKVLQEKKYFHMVFLEGTPQCGLELLVRRFRGYISDLNHNPKIISFFSANGAITTQENLFKEISQYLGLKGENDIEDITTSLRIELKKSQLVFILDNVIHPKMDQAAVHNNLETVNQLWVTICNELGKKDPNQFNKLFILVLNRDYCEHKQFKSLPVVDNINAIAAFIPPIERVKTQDILEWYDKKRFKFPDSKFDLIEQHLEEIAGDGFLASVLARLCDKIGCKTLYANL